MRGVAFVFRVRVCVLFFFLTLRFAAIEGARQADAGGEGCGAPPDVLRLACDALAQVLISMQAEEVEGAVADAQASSRASTEPVSGSLARRRGALALTAAASAAAGQSHRSSKRLLAMVKQSSRSEGLSAIDEGAGSEADGEADVEDGSVAIGRREIECYGRCMRALWGCACCYADRDRPCLRFAPAHVLAHVPMPFPAFAD